MAALFFKSVHFSENLVVCSSAGLKILTFSSHYSANFQTILDCFIPNFKLKYEDPENIKANSVSTVVLNLHQIKRLTIFFGTPGSLKYKIGLLICASDSCLYRVKPCFLSRTLPVTDKIFVHKKVFRQDLLPFKPANRHLFGYYSLFVDQMKKFGARLVFLIFTYKNFAGDRGNS